MFIERDTMNYILIITMVMVLEAGTVKGTTSFVMEDLKACDLLSDILRLSSKFETVVECVKQDK